jgi:hypothetical protein
MCCWFEDSDGRIFRLMCLHVSPASLCKQLSRRLRKMSICICSSMPYRQGNVFCGICFLLFVFYDANTNRLSFDYRDISANLVSNVTVPAPRAGKYFVGVYGYAATTFAIVSFDVAAQGQTCSRFGRHLDDCLNIDCFEDRVKMIEDDCLNMIIMIV